MSEPTIAIAANGPYLVTGEVPVDLVTIAADQAGDSREWQAGRTIPTGPKYALCRCGASGNKPFCDGTHARNGFDGTETASRAPFADQAKTIAGPGLTLHDAEALCAVARFCDIGETIWVDIEHADDHDARERVLAGAMHCPSGRLVVTDTATGAAHEPAFTPSIGLVEDPVKGVAGPLYVRGGIGITSSDGYTYEKRNRVALCRCGASANKPFCDSSHIDAKFADGLTSTSE